MAGLNDGKQENSNKGTVNGNELQVGSQIREKGCVTVEGGRKVNEEQCSRNKECQRSLMAGEDLDKD